MWVKCKSGHELCLQDKKQIRLINSFDRRGNPRAVCPHCKPDNVELVEFEPDAKSWLEEYSKDYCCGAGHVTSVYAFANDNCSISWTDGDDKQQNNVSADADTMSDLLEDGIYKCPHRILNEKTDRKRKCGRKLSSVTGDKLESPQGLHGIKTTVRLEDYWRKNGIDPDASTGTYDKDGVYSETRFQKANRQRMKKMRKRAERVSEKQGEVIDKATKKKYSSAGRPKTSDVNYPKKPIRESP